MGQPLRPKQIARINIKPALLTAQLQDVKRVLPQLILHHKHGNNPEHHLVLKPPHDPLSANKFHHSIHQNPLSHILLG